MAENIEDFRKAYYLLRFIYENDCHISPGMRMEIDELMAPPWEHELNELEKS